MQVHIHMAEPVDTETESYVPESVQSSSDLITEYFRAIDCQHWMDTVHHLEELPPLAVEFI